MRSESHSNIKLNLGCSSQAIAKREAEVAKMEKEELKLIHQLKEAQKLQKEAFGVLEGALNN